ncbi:MAG: ABC transporter permease subunit [Phycisphaerales bacterium]|nr:ABC transporter permease subunit [Phycisphaerales bacterium]MCB9862619.1 ABC transporter permease subunit [Phycisphaerales bacterium]
MIAMQIRALIVDSFREALDKKLFWIFAGLTLLLSLAMASVSISDSGVSMFFGAVPIESLQIAPSTPEGRAIIGAILTQLIGRWYIGFVGIILSIVATCGVIPSLMERGAIDVAVSKPISRSTLFLGKYFGSMVFVLIQSALFVVLTFLVAGLRWHYWAPAYLWCIPLFVILYSYLYAFTALFGVMTRNAMASFLLTMLAWLCVFAPQITYEFLEQSDAFGLKVDARWVRGAEVLKTVFPNMREIPSIAGNLIGATVESEVSGQPSSGTVDLGMMTLDYEKAEAAERRIGNVNPVTSIGSSLLFEAVIVAIAVWKFSRREF